MFVLHVCWCFFMFISAFLLCALISWCALLLIIDTSMLCGLVAHWCFLAMCSWSSLVFTCCVVCFCCLWVPPCVVCSCCSLAPPWCTMYYMFLLLVVASYCVVCFCCLLALFCYVLLVFIGAFLLCALNQHVFTMHSCCVFLKFVGASLLNPSTSLTFGAFRHLFFVHSCCSSMLSYYAFLVFFGPFKIGTSFYIFLCMCGRRQFSSTLRYFVLFWVVFPLRCIFLFFILLLFFHILLS
jgi:hypothetical protein